MDASGWAQPAILLGLAKLLSWLYDRWQRYQRPRLKYEAPAISNGRKLTEEEAWQKLKQGYLDALENMGQIQRELDDYEARQKRRFDEVWEELNAVRRVAEQRRTQSGTD